MATSVFSPSERALLEQFHARGVRFLVVGASAAVLQGANTATQDVDLWFENLGDPRLGDAVRHVAGIWVPGSFGMAPPPIGGTDLGDRFDVVVHMHGLGAFSAEYEASSTMEVDGVALRVLPIERILVNKRALGRARNLAHIPVLEEALAAIQRAGEMNGRGE